MAKILVWAVGLFFIVYGALFALIPAEVAILVTDAAPATSSALIDMRATYGGMSIAVGVTILLLASRSELVGIALLVVGVILLGMAAGRVLGMIIDGAPNAVMYIYLVAEVLFGVAALALRRPMTGEGDA